MTGVTLYVHGADDGGVLTIDNVTGKSAWVTNGALVEKLAQLSEVGGSVLLSYEETSQLAASTIDLVLESGLEVVRTEQRHPDTQRPDGATSLMAAAYWGSADLLVDLVERGAALDAADREGFTALHYAAKGEQADSAEWLVGAGAPIDWQSATGATALMIAAQSGDAGTVKLLLKAGAAAELRDRSGHTASDYAAASGNRRLADVLHSAAVSSST